MDDYLDSFHTVQETIKVSNNVTNVLNEGGFGLTKWVFNDKQILKQYPHHLKQYPRHLST